MHLQCFAALRNLRSKHEEVGCGKNAVIVDAPADSQQPSGDSRVAPADVAQLVEHSLGKGEVTSSILVIGSSFRCTGGRVVNGSRL